MILCALYNLSFTRFLSLELKNRVPDARTVWFYRDKLARAGVIEKLFADFDGYLKKRGYKAMGGRIIDASIVSVPKQRNTKCPPARLQPLASSSSMMTPVCRAAARRRQTA